MKIDDLDWSEDQEFVKEVKDEEDKTPTKQNKNKQNKP